MTFLDTNFLIQFLAGDLLAVTRMKRAEEEGEARQITPVVLYEFLIGAHIAGGKYLHQALEFAATLDLVPLDLESCDEAGKLGAALRRKGSPIGDMDTINAGAALRHRGRMVTRDSDYARVAGLVVESF